MYKNHGYKVGICLSIYSFYEYNAFELIRAKFQYDPDFGQ